MEPTKKIARTAGLFYLVIVFGGLFYLRYVPVSLIDRDHMAATIQNLSSHTILFRLGILVEVISDLFYVLLALALYRLFQQVNKTLALLLVLFVAIGTVIDLVNLQNRLAILTLVESAPQLKTFSPATMQDQVLVYLNLYRNGIRIDEIFWGLWLFPMGYLACISGFIPKIIGVLLMIGCFGYLVDFAGNFFFSQYSTLDMAKYVTIPANIGEIAICLWLLIAGISIPKQSRG